MTAKPDACTFEAATTDIGSRASLLHKTTVNCNPNLEN